MPQRKLAVRLPKTFLKSVQKLKNQGGKSRGVADKTLTAIYMWDAGSDPGIPKTHHGESRIPHVVKYQLSGSYRLVVREHAGLRIPLFVGDHDDTEQWLEANRGKDFVFDSSTGESTFAAVSRTVEDLADAQREIQPVLGRTGPMFACIPREQWSGLGLSDDTRRVIRQVATYESCDESTSLDILKALQYPSEDKRDAVLNAFHNLAHNQTHAAIACIARANKAAATASEDPKGFASAVKKGASSSELLDLSRLDIEQLDDLLDPKRFTDWMLFLASDQDKLVSREFAGPARVVGVSGSGKTCVLVHRANHLARKYPNERILILTLGRSLVRLIQHLVDQLCSEEQRNRIQVQSVYDYCYGMVKLLAPNRIIEQVDPRSGEDLAKCWEDFLEKTHAKTQLNPILNALRNRERPVQSPETYVLDELIWIRSGFGKSDRQQYLTCERPGRGIPLPRVRSTAPGAVEFGRMPADARSRFLHVLVDYEDYMRVGGLLDDDGVSLEAFALRERINERDELRARCVLVDEAQDVSTTELSVIFEIPTEKSDGIFLCGDPVQKVLPKQQNLSLARIDIRGRGAVLRRNYRNSRQILTAAFQIIDEFSSLASIPESDIIRPEFAYREREIPILYECESHEEQLDLIMNWLVDSKWTSLDSTCVCSPRRDSLAQVVERCKSKGISTAWLTGQDKYEEAGLKVAELEYVKGYEFSCVYILDLSDHDLPSAGTAWEERWRDAFHIYVAMTRARDELHMMFVENLSILLGPLGDTVEEEKAGTLLH